MVACWLGTIQAAQTSDEVIAFQDMMPTFAKLANSKPPIQCDGISIVSALKGEKLAPRHEFLYWDYGHCRQRYDQAVRWKDWKGIRLGRGGAIQLYDLAVDIGEKNNVAMQHLDVLQQIARIMDTAATVNERYHLSG